jgi:hypothetical protein
MGGLGLINPRQDAVLQYETSIKITAPLVEKIIAQAYEIPDDWYSHTAAECAK